jgi:hypothetical protein
MSKGWPDYFQTLNLTTLTIQNKYFYSTMHGGRNLLEISEHGQYTNKEKTHKEKDK